MIVAQEKRKKNITEYILYMWQVEDLIRALDFDPQKIYNTLVAQYKVDEAKKKEISAWYDNLTLMMQKEQLQKSGHLQMLVNLSDDLNRFHTALITQQIDSAYSSLYAGIKGDLELVREKSGKDDHDVDVTLNTLYIILMLKMKKQEVSEGTQNAVWKFGNFLGHLSMLFKTYEAGDLELVY